MNIMTNKVCKVAKTHLENFYIINLILCTALLLLVSGLRNSPHLIKPNPHSFHNF
jgi:hypothetical protein